MEGTGVGMVVVVVVVVGDERVLLWESAWLLERTGSAPSPGRFIRRNQGTHCSRTKFTWRTGKWEMTLMLMVWSFYLIQCCKLLYVDGILFTVAVACPFVLYVLLYKAVYIEYCIIIAAHPTRHLPAVGAVMMELEDDDCGHHWHPNNNHCAGKVLACDRTHFTRRHRNSLDVVNAVCVCVAQNQPNPQRDTHWPISGTESEVAGMISATISMKTVRESRTVMPEGRHKKSVRWGLQEKVFLEAYTVCIWYAALDF